MRGILVVGLASASLAAAGSVGVADEKLKGIACRSVHLAYPAPAGAAFTVAMTVTKSAPGTHFMACGWDNGYFGLQELGDGKKLALFSVWDPPADETGVVPEADRVKLLHQDRAVRVGRFGGEGTGGQSFLDFDWEPGTTYRFLVTAKPDGARTEYAGHLYRPETATWTHLVTFSTRTGGKELGGYYSFIEDFKRDKLSAAKARTATYGDGWVRAPKGGWHALTAARFTGDANPVTNIDAGNRAGRFFLATGGQTVNTGTKLRATIELPAPKPGAAPAPKDLPPTSE